MGRANVHVHGQSRIRTMGAVRKLLVSDGLEESPDGRRVVLIATSGEWTAVFDSDDADAHRDLARRLSEALFTRAVAWSDSEVSAFEGGTPVPAGDDPLATADPTLSHTGLADHEGAEGMLRLTFVGALSSAPEPTVEDGPPALHPGGQRASLKGRAGEVLLATVKVPSTGGRGTGVGVQAWGSAATDDIVAVRAVEVEGQGAIPEWWEDDEGDAWQEAELPDVAIPAAPAITFDLLQLTQALHADEQVLTVRIEIGLERAGTGELVVAVAPLEGEEAFSLTWDVEVA